MPPATITEVSLVQKPSHSDNEDNGLKLTHRLIEAKTRDTIQPSYKPNVYEETRPKNDPKFLAPIREWEKRMGFETALRWINLIIISLFHVISVGAFLYYLLTGNFPKLQTVLFSMFMGEVAGFGVTAGAHRYWCHRSYKAKMPLQIILMLCYSLAGQNNIYNWVRDHRVHHKFSETSADPHDARRGLFFSHVGWLMMKKHPHVLREGAKIDMSDIVNDPLVRFHTKYFNWFKLVVCFILPTLVPVYAWGETWSFALLSQPFLRYMFSLNFTWSVNSFAHIFGHKPYDRFIKPAENWFVSLVAMGEGWHNYHHTFPWDYKAAELGYTLNLTTLLLDGFARIGWAYDMKEASTTLVRTVAMNRGQRQPQ
ncbi:acyl-CoA Delta-9 desaturase isoform X2 [Pectinophora gossypiella]|nr:acyl-CoA Delta-9 desaturase isoform X2 [Pectinophora gossypiella]XP_049868578.1 acyl-CoA Delta-9 desaturase isoform X2 [Pectinophora gossypiella]XP_049868579.1 acyl-CoA Delta-9 desaturase isoform X2 [Pectinophora gossypiella]